MGILDQVIGAALGSRSSGQQRGGGLGGGLGGGSPLMMALMALLASRAGGSGGLGGALGGALGGGMGSGGGMGGLGSGGGLGGTLGGLAGGGGLGALVEQFTRNGHGETVNSWVGHGENRQIAPNQLADALGADTIDSLSRDTGMERETLLSELSHTLPNVVDRLTPDGRMPNDDEMSRW